MNDLIILAELMLLIVLYVLILGVYNKIYHSYKDKQNKLEVLSTEDDINITSVKPNSIEFVSTNKL